MRRDRRFARVRGDKPISSPASAGSRVRARASKLSAAMESLLSKAKQKRAPDSCDRKLFGRRVERPSGTLRAFTYYTMNLRVKPMKNQARIWVVARNRGSLCSKLGGDESRRPRARRPHLLDPVVNGQRCPRVVASFKLGRATHPEPLIVGPNDSYLPAVWADCRRGEAVSRFAGQPHSNWSDELAAAIILAPETEDSEPQQ